MNERTMVLSTSVDLPLEREFSVADTVRIARRGRKTKVGITSQIAVLHSSYLADLLVLFVS